MSTQMAKSKESAKTRGIEKAESKTSKSNSLKNEALLIYKNFETILKHFPTFKKIGLFPSNSTLEQLDKTNLKEILSSLNYNDNDEETPSPTPLPLPIASPDCCSHSHYDDEDEDDLEDSLAPFISIADIDTIVQYIEGTEFKLTGDSKEQNKKAAKKAKQKQKKLEQRRMVELGDLKKAYHEQCGEENELKAQLKVLKSGKKKDKKKIQELELEVKKANRVASKTESAICEIICEVREFNPEFKFSYQPPKETKPKPQPKIEPLPLKSTIIPNASLVNGNTNTFSKFVAMQRQGIPGQFHPQPSISPIIQMSTVDENETDPSKRMVTIRRIAGFANTEPQVTVTAKGRSPDQDQLLYSFINGQMVPATVLDPNIVRNLHHTLYSMNAKYQQRQPDKASVSSTPSPDSGQAGKIGKTKTDAKSKKTEKANAKKLEKEKKGVESAEKSKVVKQKDAVVDKFKTSTGKKQEKEQSKKQIPIKPEKVEKPKKKAEKPVKYDYIDPEFQLNKFGCLAINDDDDDEEQPQHSSGDEQRPEVKMPAKKLSKEKQNQLNKNNKQSSESVVVSKKKGAEVKKEVTVIKPPVVVAAPMPVVELTKKQRKKLAQKEKKLLGENKPVEENDPISRAVQKAEKMADSLTSSMKKLHLNADTTIELINRNRGNNRIDLNLTNNVSIMDQLNRGIRVEGLQLPPGITLTRVDPAKAEQIQRKRDSIERISMPQQQQAPDQSRPHLIMANPCMEVLNLPGNPEEGQVIMVEAPVFNKPAKIPEKPAPVTKSSNNKNKKVAKGGKNQKQIPQPVSQPKPIQHVKERNLQHQSKKGKNLKPNKPDPKIVTLKNPLFHEAAAEKSFQPAPVRLRTKSGAILDTPASITQNDNGIFTIRNPAFASNIGGGGLGGLSGPSPYIPTMYNPNTANGYSDVLVETLEPKAKATKAAIGSEMKKQKQVPWQPHLGTPYNGPSLGYPTAPDDQTRSYSPFNSQINLASNYANFGRQEGTSNGYNNPNNGFSAFVSSEHPHCGGHDDGSGHQCDDPHPSSLVNDQKYFREPSNKFEDMTFLQNLQPGQRLNSEVRIGFREINYSRKKDLREAVFYGYL